MPTAFIQALLFVSSFAPLIVVFGVLESFGGGRAALVCYGVALVASLALVAFMAVARQLQPANITIERASRRDGDVMSYVVTYLIPFLGIDTTGWRGRTALGIFVVVVALIYIRAELFYINPLLSIVGYRLFSAETTGRSIVLITRRRSIRAGSTLPVRSLSTEVFLE